MLQVAHAMADVATQQLRKSFPGVGMKIERMKEPVDVAVGNGSGIMYVSNMHCLIN